MSRSSARLAAVGLVVALLAGGCGGDVAESEPDVTIAFLRAVGGTASTEPSFLAALRAAGYVEGENLTVLAPDADEAYPDPEAATDAIGRWVDEGVDLIVALSSSGALVAAEAAPDVDVLFLSTDPTATGLVDDEDAPEGHLTGVSFRVPADRTLALAQRAVPGLDAVGLAFPPSDPAALAHRDAVVAAADELGIDLLLAEFTDAIDVGDAVEELAASGADALLVSTSPVATRALAETGAAATGLRLPVVANTTLADFALVALSADTAELGRQLGRQAVRLLAGESPATIPVEDPNRFVLTLSSEAAESLGLVLDPGLLREADAVTG